MSWSNILWKPGKGSEWKPDCAASIGGILFSIFAFLVFRKAKRGQEKKGLEDKRTPPPRRSRVSCLMIASKMAFVSNPWNNRTFYIYKFFDPQLIWRWSKKGLTAENAKNAEKNWDVKRQKENDFLEFCFLNDSTLRSLRALRWKI